MSTIKALLVYLVLCVAAVTAQQQQPVRTAATSVSDISTERLARLDKMLQQNVDESQIAGVVVPLVYQAFTDSPKTRTN